MSSYPRQDDSRTIQIRELQTRFPDLRVVSPGSIFDLSFRTDSGASLMLRISLSPRFPFDPPELVLSPPGRHPFLADSGRVLPSAHHSLSNWSQYQGLTDVVARLLQVFRQDPPGPQLHSSQPSQPPTRMAPQGHPTLPPIPAGFPELDKYAEGEFSQMLADEKMMDAVFESLEAVRAMRQVRADLREGNAQLARGNLEQEAAFNQRRAELVALEGELQARRGLYQEKTREREAIARRFTPQALAGELAKSAGEIDRQSEELAGQFMQQEIDWKAFSKQYLELRKLYHIRQAKREALLQQP